MRFHQTAQKGSQYQKASAFGNYRSFPQSASPVDLKLSLHPLDHPGRYRHTDSFVEFHPTGVLQGMHQHVASERMEAVWSQHRPCLDLQLEHHQKTYWHWLEHSRIDLRKWQWRDHLIWNLLSYICFNMHVHTIHVTSKFMINTILMPCVFLSYISIRSSPLLYTHLNIILHINTIIITCQEGHEMLVVS